MNMDLQVYNQCCGAGAAHFGRSREKRGGYGSSSSSCSDSMFNIKIKEINKIVNNNVK